MLLKRKYISSRVVHIKFDGSNFACEISIPGNFVKIDALWQSKEFNTRISDKKTKGFIYIYSQGCLKNRYLSLGLTI